MEKYIIIISILVLILYIKWIVILLILPFQSLFYHIFGYYSKNEMPFICKILAAPYYLWDRIFRGGWARYMLYQVGLIPSCILRKFFYKCLGVHTDKKVVFHFKTEIRDPYKLKIGKGTIIGDNAILDARNGLTIGKNVNLSSNVSIYTEQHDYRDPLFRCTQTTNKSVTIDDRAWIGSNVIILPGVTIGEGGVCCAGSVITKNVEPFSVVAGIPAKKINERPKDLIYEFQGHSCRLY